MNIWWPWRKRKPVLSLFEGQISGSGEGRPGNIPVAAQRPYTPYSKNAPGAFYVVDTECMACGYPHVLAPDLMAWDLDAEGRASHCYFKRQPETPQELEQAANAGAGSCCGALCYSGSDPNVLRVIR